MALSDILSGLSGIANTVYGLYTNQRDFDYQKALQKQIFEREDTAIQRRMNDLEAAGINPNLAAGSAAGAGSVVGRSNTPDVNFGSMLDTLNAKNQLQLQSQAKRQNNFDYQKSQQDYVYDRAMQLYNLGFNPTLAYGKDGKVHIRAENKKVNFKDSILARFQNLNLDSLNNSAAILEKQNNWFTANQVINALGSVAKDVSYFTPNFVKRLK